MRVLCDKCQWPMDGIFDSIIRTTCYSCGGKAIQPDADIEIRANALRSVKLHDEIRSGYSFRYMDKEPIQSHECDNFGNAL
jgi:hypothetical protein